MTSPQPAHAISLLPKITKINTKGTAIEDMVENTKNQDLTNVLFKDNF